MSILSKGTTFAATTQVTSSGLNNIVDAATFTNTSQTGVAYSGSTGTCLNGGGLEVTTAGQLQVKDGDIDLVKLSTDNALNSGLYGVLDKVYPVGSIYQSTSQSTTPDALFFGGSGLTTWAPVGEGKVLVGKASSGTFDTAGDDGGVETVQLTAAQSGLPSHSHTLLGGSFNGSSGAEPGNSRASDLGQTGTTGGTSATQAHTNLQPYLVVYMWKRTA